MPEPAMMIQEPLRALMALDSSVVRTNFRPGKSKGLLPSRKSPSVSFLVHAFRMAFENVGDADRHGAVQEDHDPGDAFLVSETAQVEHQLLGAFDGERRDDDVSARPDGPVDDLGQEGFDILHFFVIPVAVGRLHDHVIGPSKNGRVADDRLVPLPDVAGEYKRPLLPSPLHPDFDHG